MWWDSNEKVTPSSPDVTIRIYLYVKGRPSSCHGSVCRSTRGAKQLWAGPCGCHNHGRGSGGLDHGNYVEGSLRTMEKRKPWHEVDGRRECSPRNAEDRANAKAFVELFNKRLSGTPESAPPPPKVPTLTLADAEFPRQNWWEASSRRDRGAGSKGHPREHPRDGNLHPGLVVGPRTSPTAASIRCTLTTSGSRGRRPEFLKEFGYVHVVDRTKDGKRLGSGIYVEKERYEEWKTSSLYSPNRGPRNRGRTYNVQDKTGKKLLVDARTGAVFTRETYTERDEDGTSVWNRRVSVGQFSPELVEKHGLTIPEKDLSWKGVPGIINVGKYAVLAGAAAGFLVMPP